MEKAVTLKQIVYGALMEDIIRGNLSANDIITESSLIARFSVSKTPVREALIELCKDGFLKSLPRFGYQVVQCSIPEIMNIVEIREDLEISNLRRCFPYLSDDSLSVFRNHPEEWRNNGGDGDLYASYSRNQHFHLLLCSLSGNSYSYSMLEKVLRDTARFFAVYYSSAWDDLNETEGKYHALILDAISDGNLSDACSYLSKDISTVKDEIRKVVS